MKSVEMRFSLKMLSLLSLLAFGGTLSVQALTPSDYARTLTLTPSASAIPAGTTLPDFPALVRLSTAISGFDYGDFRLEQGADLAMTDEDGTELDYEIEKWDPSGESLIWVKIPSFTSDTVLHLYYGCETAASPDPTRVWSGYAGVWHCAEASGDLTDSTGHGFSAVPSGNSTQKMIATAGGAAGFSRFNQDNSTYHAGKSYIGGHVVQPSAQLALGQAITVSGWFHADQIIGYPRLYSTKTEYNGSTGFEVIYDEMNCRRVSVRTSGESCILFTVPNCVGAWVNIAFTIDGTTCTCYTNGAVAGVQSMHHPISDEDTPGLGLGMNANLTEAGFFGRFDEMRLRAGVASADEMRAAYRTIKDPEFFVYSTAHGIRTVADVSGFAKCITFTVSQDYPGQRDGQVALVRLSTDIEGFAYGDFKLDNAADMLFTDEDGVAIPHEIDTWDAEGASLVWVRMNSCAAGSVIRMYYGNADYVPGDACETWSDYLGVWHFREESGTAYDSGRNHYDGTPKGARAEYNVGVEGIVGRARTNGGNAANGEADKVGMVLDGTSSLVLGERFTVSGFFHVNGRAGWYRLVSRRWSGSSAGWGTELNWDDDSMLYVYGGGGEATLVTIPTLEKQWVYLTLAYDGKTCSVYANGQLVQKAELQAAPTGNGNPIAFGNQGDVAEWSLFGHYDEIRLSTGNPTAVEVAADYLTMTDADFFSASPAQSVDPAPAVFTVPVVGRNASGGIDASFKVKGGTAAYSASYDGGVVQPICETTSEKGVRTFTVSGVAADESCLCTVVATGTTGARYPQAAVESFYTGSLTVEKVSDADESGRVNGMFRISRADTEAAKRHALKVNYTLSGTAVAGVNYAGASSGSVTIPAGAASTDLVITPQVDSSSAEAKTVVITLASGAYLAGASDSAELSIAKLPPPKKATFAKRLDLTIPASFLDPYDVLTDFPVLVRLSSAIEGFDYADFKTADQSDFVFTDAHFHPLPYAVDEWHADGESLVWVFVPELRRNTQIRLYYGTTDDLAAVAPRKPWKGYAGVWHFNEGQHTVPAVDATGNGLDAVPGATHYVDGSKDYENGGAIGRARWNQPAIHVDFGRNWYTVPNYDHLAIGPVFVFSGWFRGGDKISGCPRLVSRKLDYNTNNGWDVEFAADRYTGVNARGANGDTLSAEIPDVSQGWTHLAFRYTQNSDQNCFLSVFANGELKGQKIVSMALDNNRELTFGCDADHNEPSFFGAFDELRLRPGEADDKWVEAEYKTVSDPNFVSYGTAVDNGCGMVLLFR